MTQASGKLDTIERSRDGNRWQIESRRRKQQSKRIIHLARLVILAVIALCIRNLYAHMEEIQVKLETLQIIAGKDLDDLCSLENGKYLIQKSSLGIALAFLNHEQMRVEQICRGKKDCINFAFPKEAEKLYAGTASK